MNARKSLTVAIALTLIAGLAQAHEWSALTAAMDGKPQQAYVATGINWCRANMPTAECTFGPRPTSPGFYAVANQALTSWVPMGSIPASVGGKVIRPGQSATCHGEANDPAYWQYMWPADCK